jgi:hypothetical protein
MKGGGFSAVATRLRTDAVIPAPSLGGRAGRSRKKPQSTA